MANFVRTLFGAPSAHDDDSTNIEADERLTGFDGDKDA